MSLVNFLYIGNLKVKKLGLLVLHRQKVLMKNYFQ